MLVLFAGVLLVLAALVSTLPWGRRDPARFSAADLGYVRGGPVGAVLAALGVLYVEGLVEVRGGRRGFRRTLAPLPDGAEPLVRAVHAVLSSPARLRTIVRQAGVRRAVEASATTVFAARLRTGAGQRLLGTAAALGAVALAVVAVLNDGVGVGRLVVLAVTALGAVVLWRGRFVTLAGRRLIAEVRRSSVALPVAAERRVRRESDVVHADTRLDPHPAVFAHASVHASLAVGVGLGDDWPSDLTVTGDGGHGSMSPDGGYGDGGGGGGDGGGDSGGGGGGGGD